MQTVQQMVMLSTSVLNIKWTLRGKPKSPIFSVGGDLIVRINSLFTLNQISGQVIEHQESWDLSESSLLAQVYFWTSRSLFASIEGGKDISDSVKDLTNRASTENKNVEIYPDPTGDPTKVITYASHVQICFPFSVVTYVRMLKTNKFQTALRTSFFRGMIASREISTKLHYFWRLCILLYSTCGQPYKSSECPPRILDNQSFVCLYSKQ